jgi:hypothetical protein
MVTTLNVRYGCRPGRYPGLLRWVAPDAQLACGHRLGERGGLEHCHPLADLDLLAAQGAVMVHLSPRPPEDVNVVHDGLGPAYVGGTCAGERRAKDRVWRRVETTGGWAVGPVVRGYFRPVALRSFLGRWCPLWTSWWIFTCWRAAGRGPTGPRLSAASTSDVDAGRRGRSASDCRPAPATSGRVPSCGAGGSGTGPGTPQGITPWAQDSTRRRPKRTGHQQPAGSWLVANGQR